MLYKHFMIDELKSSTVFVDIPQRSYAKTFYPLGPPSSPPPSLKITWRPNLLSSKASDFGFPHFHPPPKEFLDLHTILSSYHSPPCSHQRLFSLASTHVFSFFSSFLHCPDWKPAQVSPRFKTHLLSLSCYSSEHLSASLENYNLHILLLIYLLISLASEEAACKKSGL